jgi:hypothetical protein
MDILPLFCDIDDFCRLFEPAWRQRLLTSGKCRHKPGSLSLSEVMTILVLFHASGYRDFKTFYTRHVTRQLGGAFPKLVSYNRFVELQREALVPLWCYLHTRRGRCTGAPSWTPRLWPAATTSEYRSIKSSGTQPGAGNPAWAGSTASSSTWSSTTVAGTG